MKKTLYTTDQNNPVIKAYVKAVEKGEKDQHIIPKEHGWIVKPLLSNKRGQIFSTIKDAEKYAESIAMSIGASVFIHGNDGRIKQRKDYNISL